MHQSQADAVLARALARAAGRLLKSLRSGALCGDALRAAGDREANAYLLARLAEERPEDAVLSEESPDDASRLAARRVWIVDPLDGTREFGEPGRDDWAVHVALWEDGELAAGAVALPAQGITAGTDLPPEVPPRGGPEGPESVPDDRLRIAVSRSRPPRLAQEVATALDAHLVPLGSAGAKCAAVWQGQVDAYLHQGGQHEWDSAAPVAVAHSCGLVAVRLDGSPLRYNQADPYLPDLLVARPEIADTLLAAVATSTPTLARR